MNIDLTRNYFELFGIPERFEVNQQELSDKYRALQKTLHPDRFVNSSDQEKRISMQTTAYVNEGYTTLKNDLSRAHYLIKLKDNEFDADTETSNDTEFLVQQMDLHECVDKIDSAKDPLASLDVLEKKLKRLQEELIMKFSKQYSENNIRDAKDSALKLQFFERLKNQLRKKQEHFEEGLL